MKRLFHLFPIVGIFLLFGCTSPLSRTLDDVEGYISEHPDSALKTLRSIDTYSISRKADRAKYSLLHAMALDKNYIDTTDLAVINPALDYYGKHKDKSGNREAMSQYYAGRICTNAENNAGAMLYLNQALENLDSTDFLYRGLTYTAIGNVYNTNRDVWEELKYRKLAHVAFERLGDENYLDISRNLLAMSYHNNKEYKTSDSLQSLIHVGRDSTRQIALLAMRRQADNALCFAEPEYGKAISLYEYLMSRNFPLALEDYCEYAYALVMTGNRERADGILSQVERVSPQNAQSYYWRYKTAKALGKTTEALDLLDHVVDESNKIVSKQIKQSASKAQAAYYKLKSEQNESKASNYKLRLALLSLLSLAAVSAIVSIHAVKNRRLKDKMDMLHTTVEESEKLLAEYTKKNEGLQEDFKNLRGTFVSIYQEQFKEIGKNFNLYSSQGDQVAYEKSYEKLKKSIDGIISDLREDTKNQKTFEKRIDRDLDGVITKLRTDFPEFKDNDIRFISYMLSGFDTSFMAIILGLSKENVRLKRHRYRNKILSNEGKNSGLYRMLFGK